MSICNSCGGIVGIDCFNVSDCASISRNNADQDHWDIYELKLMVDLYKQALIDNGIPIPELYNPPKDENNYCFTDGLPY